MTPRHAKKGVNFTLTELLVIFAITVFPQLFLAADMNVEQYFELARDSIVELFDDDIVIEPDYVQFGPKKEEPRILLSSRGTNNTIDTEMITSIEESEIAGYLNPANTFEAVSKVEYERKLEAERMAEEARKRAEYEAMMARPRERVTQYTDLMEYKPVTVEELNKIMDHFAEYKHGSYPLQGTAEYFIKAGEVTGLNPIYLFAHAAVESGWGTSKMAVNKKNFFGINAVDHKPSNAYHMGNNTEDGIVNGAIWIKENFYDNNQKNLHDMIYNDHFYASAGQDWINQIVWIMNKFINQ